MIRIDFTITKELIDMIKNYAKQTGLKQSEIVRQALTKYFSDKKINIETEDTK